MKILVVDDNEDARLLQETILAAQGYTIECAENGAEALKITARFRPDMIISDIFMPEMDGFDLCHAVKNDKRLRTIAFVFYTAAYTDARAEALGMELGASRFIVKPMDTEEFLVEIEKVLKEYKEGKLPVPKHPKLGEEELVREHDKIQLEKLKERVKELEREKKELEESEE